MAIYRRVELDTNSVVVTKIALRRHMRECERELKAGGGSLSGKYLDFYAQTIQECKAALRLIDYPQATMIHKEESDDLQTV